MQARYARLWQAMPLLMTCSWFTRRSSSSPLRTLWPFGFLAAMWSRGEREQFWAFWVLCPLLEHLPTPLVPISDITIGDGPYQCAVSCAPRRGARCEAGRGGYQFPFLGPWTRKAVLVPPGMGPQKAGQRYFRDHSILDSEGQRAASSAVHLQDLFPPE